MSEIVIPQDAIDALDAAMDTDAGQTVAPPADGFDPANTGLPQGDSPQVPNVPTPPAEDPAPVAPEATQEAEESFAERFDPNTLPAELQSAYKLMQADYTRKRQADAEAIRLVQQYQGVDLDAAVQLFQGIQDPNQLLQFVNEANQYLVEQGLAEFDGGPTPEVPAAPAGENNLTQALASLAQSDPELAPLAEAVQAMQSRLDTFESRESQRLAAEREEHLVLQAMGELQRQENVIRTDNPHYDQSDVDAIYELASHYDGDLFKAQERYEAQFASRLGRYMRAKEGAPAPAVPTGLPQAPPTPELQYDPLDPKQAHNAALEVLKLIESQPG